jgi:hypothetical protein
MTRLIVGRVKDLNRIAGQAQGELFPVWRCCLPPDPWPASAAPKPEQPPCAATSSTSLPAPPATAAATSPCTYPKAGTASRGGKRAQTACGPPATMA